MAKIAPSILSANFSRLGSQVKAVSKAGADYIHIDVMDGHFVPNISFGAPVMKCLNDLDTPPYDVHLMISEPGKYFEDFVTDKTGFITFHQEAETHMNSTIQRIKAAGIGAGVAINPATPIWTLDEVLEDVDLILVMSVNPGFGGQKLIPSTLKKVRKLIEIREKNGFDWQIEIDGGVNRDTLPSVIDSGVDILVAGSAVFNAKYPAEEIQYFKELL